MFKKFAVAAAVVLIAGSAMATNFRVSDQVYVPAAAVLNPSASSAGFATDLFVANLESFPVTVSVIFSAGASGSQTAFNNLFTLAAGERREIKNFVGTSTAQGGLGLGGPAIGQLVFNGCKQGASCGEDADPLGTNYGKISVEARVYSIPAGSTFSQSPAAPTTGQLLSGYPWYNYVSMEQSQNGLDRVFLTGLRQSAASGAGTYRSNIGLANASQFSTTTLIVTLRNGTGTQLGQARVALGPLGHTQPALTTLFPGVTFTDGMWAEISQDPAATGVASGVPGGVPTGCQPPQSNGCPGFFAYGSVLDNVSGDATTLEPQYFKALNDAQIACIYPSSTQTNVCKGTPVMRRAVRH